jgi:hypothetical protein
LLPAIRGCIQPLAALQACETCRENQSTSYPRALYLPGQGDESRHNAAHLSDLRPFTSTEARAIVEGAVRSQNIYGGYAAGDFVDAVIARNKTLDSGLVSKFRTQVRAWDSP